MRKFTLLAVMALASTLAFGQTMQRRDVQLDVKRMNVAPTATQKMNIRKAAGDEVITEAPEGETKTYSREGSCWYFNSQTYQQEVREQLGYIEFVFTDNDEVYIKDPITNYATGVYVKGTKNGNTITVATNQPVLYSERYAAYVRLALMVPDTQNDGEYVADLNQETVTYTIDGNQIKLEGTSEDLILSAYWDDDDSWTGYGDWNSVYTEFAEQPNAAPDGLETTTYTLITSGSKELMKDVTVGVADGKLYVQGVAEQMPEGWFIGEINGNTVTFSNGQYLGNSQYGPIFLCGSDNGTEFGPIEMTYDEGTDTYTMTTTYMIINGEKTAWYYYDYFTSFVLTHVEDEAVVPADPEIEKYWPLEDEYYPELDFYMPTTDVDGNDLRKDKLFYQVYLQVTGGELEPYTFTAAEYGSDEDMTLIPAFVNSNDFYGFNAEYNNIHFFAIVTADDSNMEKLGVQAVYLGGGEETRSNIVYYDILTDEIVTGINEVKTEKADDAIYTINGMRVQNASQRGIYIKNGAKYVVK